MVEGFTVNLEIFRKGFIFQNFTYAKFRENIILTDWRNHSVFY